MKKILFTFFVLCFTATLVMAQSLLDNEFYKKSKSLETEAKTAFDNGDYDASARLSAEAKENARLSDEYVDKMLMKYTANDAIKAAQARYDEAGKGGAAKRFESIYAEATLELAAAKASYASDTFDVAITHANKVVELLAGVKTVTLPAYFVVRRVPSNPDCFWKIAGLPSVYNDPTKWPILYNANKKVLRDPNNPNLIHPGMKFVIPAIAGETRDGVWSADQSYPKFEAKAK